MIRLARTLFLIAGCSPILASAASPNADQALQEGMQFGNANQPATSGLNPSNVPGYTTSNPSQTSLYNDPAALEDAGVQAVGQDAASQTVLDGLDQRPVFNLDPATDPMLQNARQLSDQATQAALTPDGQIATQFPGCTTQTQNAGLDLQATCTADRTLRPETCQRTLEIRFREEMSCQSLTWFWQQETPITWHAFGYGWQTGRAGVRILCDPNLARQGKLRLQVWARGTRPPYAQPKEVIVDTRQHGWRSPTGYDTTWTTGGAPNEILRTSWAYPWGGTYGGFVAFEERGGCSNGQCRYTFRIGQWPALLWWGLGWLGSNYQTYLISADIRDIEATFPLPALTRVPVDHWVSDCATLEARSR